MKILIFEDGGFTTKVLTRLLVARDHKVTALKGVMPSVALIGINQEMQTVAFEPSDFDLAFIDQNIYRTVGFTELVAALSRSIPCIGLSTMPETNLVFKQNGAKLALTKATIFAGLYSDRIDCSHVKELSAVEEELLLHLQSELVHPTCSCMKELRKQTDGFLMEVMQG
ncbi:MAG TPA: hypothetical protein V6C97_32620 [Oculatellaceae cyanobacterium]